jgi:hypothetical protein
MRLGIATTTTVLLLTLGLTAQPASQGDAWPLYEKAIARIREGDAKDLSSPAASSMEYSYPPFSAAWKRHEKKSYEFNAPALELIRQAAAADHASWPVERKGNDVVLKYLGELRNVANEVADAANYDHLEGNDTLALSRIEDLLHLADLLDKPNDELLVQGFVAEGVRTLALFRLAMVAPELAIANEPKSDDGANTIPAPVVRALIQRLFTNDDPTSRVDTLIDHEKTLKAQLNADWPPMEAESIERAKLVFRRGQMERNLIAMSLACQLYRADHSGWPTSLDGLLAYLPAAPKDYWGPMGYVLLRGTGAADRPLVYSRCKAEPGQTLAYPARDAVYLYYNQGSLGIGNQPIPGQFRDVSMWQPPKGQNVEVLRQLK